MRLEIIIDLFETMENLFDRDVHDPENYIHKTDKTDKIRAKW